MSISPAPVLLFTYKRLGSLKQTVSALQANFLASDTELFIFSDGPKNESDREKINLVRQYLNDITGFKKITINRSNVNKGLASSVIDGVSSVLKTYKSVIVLEDDLVTAPNFLTFMNQALGHYEHHPDVFSVSGYTFPIAQPSRYKYDAYFNRRGCSWGWATWSDRWEFVDWHLLKKVDFKALRQTKVCGSDFPSLVRKYKDSSIDSWAVPWCYYQFIKGFVTVYPVVSKVRSVGFDSDATHTFNSEKRFATNLDDSLSCNFSFEDNVNFNRHYIKEFLKKFSFFERVKWRLIAEFGRIVR